MAYAGRHLGMGFGGKVDFGVSPNAPSASQGTQTYKAGGGSMASKSTAWGETAPTLLLLVLAEVVALGALRHSFRNFHGG
jgi:hypothetical protein